MTALSRHEIGQQLHKTLTAVLEKASRSRVPIDPNSPEGQAGRQRHQDAVAQKMAAGRQADLSKFLEAERGRAMNQGDSTQIHPGMKVTLHHQGRPTSSQQRGQTWPGTVTRVNIEPLTGRVYSVHVRDESPDEGGREYEYARFKGDHGYHHWNEVAAPAHLVQQSVWNADMGRAWKDDGNTGRYEHQLPDRPLGGNWASKLNWTDPSNIGDPYSSIYNPHQVLTKPVY